MGLTPPRPPSGVEAGQERREGCCRQRGCGGSLTGSRRRAAWRAAPLCCRMVWGTGGDELSASLRGRSASGPPRVHPLSPRGVVGRRLTAPQGRLWLLLQSGLGAARSLPWFPHTFCMLPHLCFFPFSVLKCDGLGCTSVESRFSTAAEPPPRLS